MSRYWVLVGAVVAAWLSLSPAAKAQTIKKEATFAPGERPDETTLPPGRDAALPPGAIMRLGSIPLRHLSAVTGLMWSSNGKMVISTGDDGTRFWSAERGVLLHAWPEAKSSVLAVTLDGRTVAAGGADGVIRLWDVQQALSGISIKPATRGAATGGAKIRCLAFSPDGKQLASIAEAREVGDSEAVVRLFDVATGNERRQFKDIANGGHAIAFSPDGARLVAAEGSRGSVRGLTEIRVWNIATGEVIQRLPGHPSWVEQLSYSRDGRTLVSSCAFETRQWDVTAQREICRWEGATHGRITADGKRIVMARGPNLEVRDAASGEMASQLRGYWGRDSSKLWAIAPDGQTLATVASGGLIHFWTVATGQERVLYAGHRGTIEAAVWSPDGSLILTGGSDNTLRLWGAATGLQLRLIELPPNTNQWGKNTAGLGFTAEGRAFFAGQTDGAIRMWSVATGKLIQKITGHQNWITDVAAAPGGELLASAGWDGTLRLWDPEKATLRRFLMGKDDSHGDTSIAALTFAPDGKQLVSAAGNRYMRNRDKQKTLQLWDVATGQLMREFGPAGERMLPKRVVWQTARDLYAESNQTIQHWDPQTGDLVHEYRARHKQWRETPTFGVSRDGKLLAIGDNDGIHLWDTLTRQEIRTIATPAQPLECLTFSPEGKQLLAGYAGGTLLVWDLAALALPAAPKAIPPVGKNPQETQTENFKRWWTALGRREVDDSLTALWHFVRAGDGATAWLGQNVPPALARDLRRLPHLIKELHDADAQTRATALAALGEFGAAAAPALYEALREPLPMPVRRRLELALAFIDQHPFHPDELRRLRAIEILERIGTAAAEPTLERWSRDEAKAPATAAARDAWQRVHTLRRLVPTPVLSDADIDRQERPKIGSRPPRVLAGGPGSVAVLAFAADGKRLLCGGPKSPLRVYDLANGQLIRAIEDFPAIACAVAGSRCAVAGAQGQLLIARFDDDDDVYVKERGALTCVAMSPDGAVLAAGTEDGFLGLWTAAGKKLRTAKTSLKKLTAVSFLPDGQSLLLGGIVDETADFNGRLRFTQLAAISQWSVADAKEIRRYGARGSSLALHPDGRTLVAGGLARFFAKNWRGGGFVSIGDTTFTQGNKLTFWDLQRDREIRTIDAQGARPLFSPAGDLLLAWGEDAHQETWISWGTNEMGGSMSNNPHVQLLDAATASAVPLGKELPATVAALAADGHTLAWGDARGNVTVWDLRPAGPPAQSAIESWWDDLSDLTDGRAWQASWSLAAFPDETLALLRKRVQPVPLTVGPRIGALLADLDNPAFVRRDQASAELRKLGRTAERDLLHARAKASTPEASRRLDSLLEGLTTPQAEDIRAVRAIHLLRRLGIPGARQLLNELSQGYPHAFLTQEAQRMLR